MKTTIVSGMGLAMSIITSLIKAVMDAGGNEDHIHRLATPQGEATLRKLAAIIVADASSEKTAAAEERVPKDGDTAYTIYRDHEFTGILSHMNTRGIGWIVPASSKMDWGYHGYVTEIRRFRAGLSKSSLADIDRLRGLSVGYEEKIVWDKSRGMWYAPADSD